MDDFSKIYHEAIKTFKRQHLEHFDLFALSSKAYDKFYNYASKHGESQARIRYPDEANKVDAIERASSTLQSSRDNIFTSLITAIESKASSLGSLSSAKGDKSVIDSFRTDMLALDMWRIKELDGINGKMWELIEQGHGHDKKQSNRLLNRVVTTWAMEHGKKPLDLIKGVTLLNTALNDGIIPNDEALLNYPSDFDADFEKAINWTEVVEEIEAPSISYKC